MVATAWAQQPTPALAEAEKALRARAEQFYQLEVDKKFRQAEAFVAEDSKDLYYGNSKPDIRKFSIGKIEFSEDGKQAKVTVMITSVMKVPNMPGMEFTSPVPMTWKLDNGEWCWYQIQNGDIDTPFGKWHVSTDKNGPATSLPQGMADPSSLQSLITLDKKTIELQPGATEPQTAVVTNHLAGDITLKVVSAVPEGLRVSFSSAIVHPGASATLSFTAATGTHPNGIVAIAAGPLQEFRIQVHSK